MLQKLLQCCAINSAAMKFKKSSLLLIVLCSSQLAVSMDKRQLKQGPKGNTLSSCKVLAKNAKKNKKLQDSKNSKIQRNRQMPQGNRQILPRNLEQGVEVVGEMALMRDNNHNYAQFFRFPVLFSLIIFVIFMNFNNDTNNTRQEIQTTKDFTGHHLGSLKSTFMNNEPNQ
ncbi:MAG: hypothetical protein AB7R69_04795 [Candidatus Babeliales bacterium]